MRMRKDLMASLAAWTHSLGTLMICPFCGPSHFGGSTGVERHDYTTNRGTRVTREFWRCGRCKGHWLLVVFDGNDDRPARVERIQGL